MGYVKKKVNVKEIIKVMKNHKEVEDYRRKRMRQLVLLHYDGHPKKS